LIFCDFNILLSLYSLGRQQGQGLTEQENKKNRHTSRMTAFREKMVFGMVCGQFEA
jgi:hypothetical protein